MNASMFRTGLTASLLLATSALTSPAWAGTCASPGIVTGPGVANNGHGNIFNCPPAIAANSVLLSFMGPPTLPAGANTMPTTVLQTLNFTSSVVLNSIGNLTFTPAPGATPSTALLGVVRQPNTAITIADILVTLGPPVVMPPAPSTSPPAPPMPPPGIPGGGGGGVSMPMATPGPGPSTSADQAALVTGSTTALRLSPAELAKDYRPLVPGVSVREVIAASEEWGGLGALNRAALNAGLGIQYRASDGTVIRGTSEKALGEERIEERASDGTVIRKIPDTPREQKVAALAMYRADKVEQAAKLRDLFNLSARQLYLTPQLELEARIKDLGLDRDESEKIHAELVAKMNDPNEGFQPDTKSRTISSTVKTEYPDGGYMTTTTTTSVSGVTVTVMEVTDAGGHVNSLPPIIAQAPEVEQSERDARQEKIEQQPSKTLGKTPMPWAGSRLGDDITPEESAAREAAREAKNLEEFRSLQSQNTPITPTTASPAATSGDVPNPSVQVASTPEGQDAPPAEPSKPAVDRAAVNKAMDAYAHAHLIAGAKAHISLSTIPLPANSTLGQGEVTYVTHGAVIFRASFDGQGKLIAEEKTPDGRALDTMKQFGLGYNFTDEHGVTAVMLGTGSDGSSHIEHVSFTNDHGDSRGFMNFDKNGQLTSGVVYKKDGDILAHWAGPPPPVRRPVAPVIDKKKYEAKAQNSTLPAAARVAAQKRADIIGTQIAIARHDAANAPTPQFRP